MEYQKLSWASVRLNYGSSSVLIDAIEGVGMAEGVLGQPKRPMLPLGEPGSVDFALVTHLHPDHYDPAALRHVLGSRGAVVCDARVAPAIRRDGLRVVPIREYDTIDGPDFSVTAVPAVEGFGEPQLSWVVNGDNRTVIHCGDTLFHGYWWSIAQEYGPFDVAFLPINGVHIQLPGFEPSGLPAVMNADEAAVAGRLLKADVVVPVHYDTYNNPPLFVEQENAEQRFVAAAAREGVKAFIVDDGDVHELPTGELRPEPSAPRVGPHGH